MFSNSEKARFVDWWVESGRSYVTFSRRVHAELGNHAKVPGRKAISGWVTKFRDTGSVARRTPVFSNTVRTEAKVAEVRAMLEEDPHLSVRRTANAADVSVGTAHAIMRGDIHFHPYKLQLVQELLPHDHAARIRFAEGQLAAIEGDPHLLENLVFSDEAHLHLSGEVNRHDFRYWSNENPHWHVGEPLHSPRVTVWAGIGHRGIVGPFFFTQTVNSERYLALLRDHVMPALNQLPNRRRVIFMQDGAPPHFGTVVRDFLNAHLPNRWMGRGSAAYPWPPRSPDLTPMDFFFWGYLKSKVYTDTPFPDLDSLRQRIVDECAQVPLERGGRSVETR
jgi:hypothetical protein